MIELPIKSSVQRKTTTSSKARKKTSGIIAIDNGGENTKVLSEDMEHPVSFGSTKAIGKPRHKQDPILPPELHSHLVEWEGKIYLTNYRVMQSKARKSSLVNTKSDDYFILSILIAIAKYGYDENYVITCVPYSRYSDEEKEAIERRLIRKHTLAIDGQEYNFEIKDVIIVPETMVAFFHLKPYGRVRLLDIGSRTVGYATMYQDEKFFQPIFEETGTIEKEGLEARRDVVEKEEYDEYVENLAYELDHVFNEDDEIIAFGGGVLIPQIVEGLKKKYPNLTVAEEPLFVQVRGMLEYGLNYLRGDVDEEEE
jgi:hypothetical protein